MKWIPKLIWSHQKYIGASYDTPERYILAVRPTLDELAKTGGWTQMEDEAPVGYPRNILAFRPDAPVENRVVSVWFDPFDKDIEKKHPNGVVSEYPVTAWMECPEEPI